MHLFSTKGFLPYILIVFLNAFTDLGHKIIIQNTVFKVYDGSEQIILTAIINALMLLPFILLFTPSGYMSDKYQKDKVMKISALASVILTIFITISYYLGFFWVAFFLTFLLATKSAFYSPAKYGYIKELLGVSNIGVGNGVVQSVTIVAILGGIFAYSIGFELLFGGANSETILQHIAPLGFLLIIGSLIELYLAFLLPNRSFTLSGEEFSYQKYFKGKYLKRNLRVLKTNKIIYLSILGLAIFWAISQVVLAVFPSYIKENLGVDSVIVVQGLMALSAIGIIIGSIIGAKISKNYIEIGMIPIASFGLFLTILAITFLDSLVLGGVNFLLFGVFGGMLLVPLNSLIQFHASNKRLGLILSGNNFIQNIFMFSFLCLTVAFSFIDIKSEVIFYLLAVVAFISFIYAVYKIPQSLIRLIVAFVFSIKYKLIVQEIENIPQNGGVLLLGNHISWLDWAFVQMASPRAIRFVMERSIYEKRFLKPFFDLFRVIPISSGGGRKSLLEVTNAINNGEVVCIFPEGGISRSGHLGEFKKGFLVATLGVKSGVIVPFYIGGLWGTKWSRSNINFKEINENRYKKDVIVSFGKGQNIKSNDSEVKKSVFELASRSWDRYIENFTNIDKVLIESVKLKGERIALVDESGEYSYFKMFLMALYFKNKIKQHKEPHIGILLPTTAIGAILNIATLLAGKTIVNLKYSSLKVLNFGIKEAGIKNIYTSKRFIAKLCERGFDIDEIGGNCKFIYLEDLKKQTTIFDFVLNYLQVIFIKFSPLFVVQNLFGSRSTLDSIGTILFTLKGDDTPKGIVLSHRNMLANVKQIGEMLNLEDDEVFLGNLPHYSSFGFFVTLLVPVLNGVKIAFHPNPTDVLGASKVIAKNRVTFMCTSSSLLELMLEDKNINPLMVGSLKMIFTPFLDSSQNLQEDFLKTFGVKLYYGFGISECCSIVCANIPDSLDINYWQVQIGNKKDKVGMPLSGVALRIVDSTTMSELGIDNNGEIIVSGSSVMVGYLNDIEKSNDVFVELDGKVWYKTGQIGQIDSDGFVKVINL